MTGKTGKRLLLAVLMLCMLWSAAAAAEREYADYIRDAAVRPATEALTLFQGEPLLVEQGNSASFAVQVPAGGLYALEIGYTLADTGSAAGEYTLEVDGETPYAEAASPTLPRLWQQEHEIRQDEQGNDLRAPQVSCPVEQTCLMQDSSGLVQGPLLLALEAGEHTLTLHIEREDVYLHSLRLTPPPVHQPYQRPEEQEAQQTVRVQGESFLYANDMAIIPQTDRASALTEPNRGAKICLNMIGSTAFSKPGSAITWAFDVPESGLYELRLRVRQNYSRAFDAVRVLRIDGEIPFAEAEEIHFAYDDAWQMVALGGTEPYLFQLEAGRHTVTLEAALGEYAQSIADMQSSLDTLNQVYMDIMMLTGASPDPLRDYAVERNLPGSMERMREGLAGLEAAVDCVSGQMTGRGSDLVPVERLIRQLDTFVQDPYLITEQFESFKTNLSALGDWILTATERALDIDYLELAAPSSPLPRAEANLWENLRYQASLFLDSFHTDYNSFSAGEGGQEITVWVTSSRDRAQTLNDLIRTDFTPKTGIRVNLQLVASDNVTPSVCVGNGPDVLLGAAMGDPVNYASRHAAYDLTSFPDYEEVAARFHEQASAPFAFEGGVYALPETLSHMMMFYRTDILEQLGVEVPQTWDEMIALIPRLSRSNMMFLVDGRVGTEVYGSMTGLSLFLFQRDCGVYAPDSTRVILDTEEALDAFKRFTQLYTNYGMPYSFNTAVRFRSGEAPIVIADYSLYNTLMVSAPEIIGQWAMAPVPGVRDEQGEINRSVRAVVTGDMILRDSQHKQEAWEFIKWCTSAPVQAAYSMQLESVLGAAARYQTANREALGQLNWRRSDLMMLEEQQRSLRAMEEVPGGYYTAWHVENAFRAVVLSGEDPREAMLDYVRVIN
ncbi:MAG: extracellular solute-binding protein, partial [Aristaeellaceae bacterium]